MTAHTRGPWSVPHFATDCSCNCAYVLSDNQHGMGAIATVHHSDEVDGEHNEPMDVAIANARLIAAAPTLLEELAKFAAKANGYDGVPPPKYFGDIDCELRYPDSLKIEFTLGELRAARKAIAAATQQEQTS